MLNKYCRTYYLFSMGLLDFFSKGGNDPKSQGNVTSPSVPDFSNIQQSYTNQSLANISYPMPSVASNNLPAAPAPVQTEAQPVQNLQLQAKQSTAPVQDATPSPVPNGNGEKDIPSYEYADPSKHPVLPEVHPSKGYTTEMPEGVKVTTFEPNDDKSDKKAAPESVEDQAEDEKQDLDKDKKTDDKAALLTDTSVENLTANALLPPLPASTDPLDITSMPVSNVLPAQQPSTTEAFETAVESTVEDAAQNAEASINNSFVDLQSNINNVANGAETSTEVTAVAEPAEPEPQPEVNSPAVLEVGVGSSTEPVAPLPTLPELPAIPTQPAEVSAPLESFTPEVEEGAEVETSAAIDTLPAADITTTEEVKPPEAVNLEADSVQIVPPIVEVENLDQQKESSTELAPEPVATPVDIEISYFRTVGFIGLNNEQPNSKVIEKVDELASKLAEKVEAFVIDSAKGYAKGIFDNAKVKGIEITGMYLKPFYSGYTDEAEIGEYENYTVMMFSSSTDKIKNIIKESDILVIPEVTGLNNLGVLFEVWSTNSIYPGQHKPLILIGKGWSSILTQLKGLFKLSDNDLSFVNVCQTADEALTKIAELDGQYLAKGTKQPKKIIDLREEDDEEVLFI